MKWWPMICCLSWLLIMSDWSHGQSPLVMEHIPKWQPAVDMYHPKSVSQALFLSQKFSAIGIASPVDTMHLRIYNDEGKQAEYIDWEKNKRSSHYFTEYPTATTEIMFNYYDMQPYGQCKSVSFFEYDASGYRIAATNSQVVEGVEKILNIHEYKYNSLGQKTFQCDMCQSENRYLYHLHYADTFLIAIDQYRGDTTRLVEMTILDYDSLARLTALTKSNIYNEVAEVDQTYLYKYNDQGQLVQMTEIFAFEKGVDRWHQIFYDTTGAISRVISSIRDMQKITNYTYENGLLIQQDTDTTFPIFEEGGVWFSASAKHYGEKKESRIQTRWNYDDKGNAIKQEISVNGSLRQVYWVEMVD
jgi:hypothetical protein